MSLDRRAEVSHKLDVEAWDSMDGLIAASDAFIIATPFVRATSR